MADAFEATSGVDILVPPTVVMPAVLIALLSPLAGRIVDRTGRVRLLIGSLIVYALVGTAPLWLPTLELAVVSRAGAGVAEAEDPDLLLRPDVRHVVGLRTTGVWFSCVTTARFACPLAVLAIGAVAGGLSGALLVLGVPALVLAVTAGRIRTA